jgi:threonine dehydratase
MTSDTDIPAGRATRGPEVATDFDAGPVDIATIEAARAALGDLIVETPVLRWQGREIDALVPPGTEVVLKLELMQRAGSFKARGALLNVMALDAAARARGVTAVSAGNHAIATSYAAWRLGVDAKVVMMKTASPFRVDACRAYGAEVVLAEDVQAAFAQVHDLVEGEGRTLVHPFEGPRTALGTATMGLEFLGQAPGLDAVVIPIGGGGLSAGASAAIKLADPSIEVIGVEPHGADSMHRSFAAGEPQRIDAVRTIADSLGAPFAMPYSFGLVRDNVDDLVKIDDDAMCRAMALLYREVKLAVEPAGAAATAALLGPLRDRLAGKRVGIIVCGSSIDIDRFAALVRRGEGRADPA